MPRLFARALLAACAVLVGATVVMAVGSPAVAGTPVARFHGTGTDSYSAGRDLKFTASGSWNFSATAPKSCVMTRNRKHFGYFSVSIYRGATGMKVVHSSTGNGVPHYSWRGPKGSYHFEVFTGCPWTVSITGAHAGVPTYTRIIADCAHQRVKPTRIVLSCGDGKVNATQLKFTSYTRTSATARGQVLAVTCQPSCAAGREHAYPATIAFSRVRTKSGHSVFTRARVTYLKATPYGSRHQSFVIA